MDKNFAKYGEILQEWVFLTYIFVTLSSNKGNFVCTRTPKLAKNVKNRHKLSYHSNNILEQRQKKHKL